MTENGHTDDLQKLKEERDAYQRAATIAEANELTLHRKLSGYQEEELEQLRGELKMWRKRAEESARETLEEREVSEGSPDREVSEPS